MTYTFNLLPGITLTNAFLVSDQVLNRLSVRCWLFDLQGQFIWQNAIAKREPIGLSTLAALVTAHHSRPAGASDAVLDDGSMVRIISVRNLAGTVIAVLATADPWQSPSVVQIGVAVCEDGRFVLANESLGRLLDQNLVGSAWDEVANLPAWAAVSQWAIGQTFVVVGPSYDLKIHRVGKVAVLEGVPRVLGPGQVLHFSTPAEMVHEIRNPLSALRGLLELAQVASEAPRLPEYLQQALVQVERLDTLAEQMLLWTKPLVPVLTECGLEDALSDAWAMVDSDLRGAIRLDLRGPLGTVEADPDLFHQVLLNILKNAAEATGGHGTITVSASHQAHLTVIEIQDDGPGMAETVMAELFERGQTTKPSGSGLG